jgi:hypothetical protein
MNLALWCDRPANLCLNSFQKKNYEDDDDDDDDDTKNL